MTEPGSAEATGTDVLKRALRLAGTDAARYLPVRFVPALVSLITVPLFTRAIAPADYGAFHLVNSFLVLGAGVASEWIGVSAIRLYWPSRKAGRLSEFVSTIVWTALASLLACSALIALVSYLGRNLLDPLVLRLMPVSIAYFFMNYLLIELMQILRAANRAADYARLSIATTLVTNALAVLFVVGLGWGALGIFAGVAAGGALMAPWTLSQVAREGTPTPARVRRDTLRDILTYGAPLIPAGAASWALGLTDRFVIGLARGAAEVGLYATAYNLGEKVMQLVTLPLILTMVPVLVQTFEQHGQLTAERMQTQFTRYFGLITVPLLFGVIAVARDFLAVLTGAEYHEAYPVLAIVTAGALLVGLNQLAMTGLSIRKATKRIMANTLIATGANLALNVAFVPRFGYGAAAYSTVGSYALLLALTAWRSRDLMAWRVPWRELAPVAAASLAMAIAVHALGMVLPTAMWSLGAQVALGVVLYAAALRALGGVRPEERAFLAEAVAGARARMRR